MEAERSVTLLRWDGARKTTKEKKFREYTKKAASQQLFKKQCMISYQPSFACSFPYLRNKYLQLGFAQPLEPRSASFL